MPSKKIFDIFPPKRIQKPELKKSFQKKQERKRKIGFSFSNPLRNILFFILILIFVLLIFLSLSAKAEINIIPQTEKVFSKDNFSVDTNVSDLNFLEKVMPGFFFSKEKEITKEFKATGITGKKGKASGMIKVYNNYHLSQTLVATTRFVSADGKLFRSKEDIVIPAESTADVYVEAAEPGPDYNIKPSTFSIPGLLGSPRYTAVYGKSFSDMKGGLVGNLPQITKQDLENAEKELLEILTDLLKQELEKEAGESILLLDDAISKEVLESSCTRDELEEVEGFECTLYLKCKALGFLKADLEDFAKQSLLKEISESKSIKKDSLKIESQKAEFYLILLMRLKK